MAQVRKTKAKAWERVDLAEDGILSAGLQQALHDMPHQAHLDAVAQMANIDEASIPRFDTVAELLTWVQTVLAAGGNPQAMKLIADRLAPVVTKTEEKVDLTQRGAPVASSNDVERQEAESYLRALNE